MNLCMSLWASAVTCREAAGYLLAGWQVRDG